MPAPVPSPSASSLRSPSFVCWAPPELHLPGSYHCDRSKVAGIVCGPPPELHLPGSYHCDRSKVAGAPSRFSAPSSPSTPPPPPCFYVVSPCLWLEVHLLRRGARWRGCRPSFICWATPDLHLPGSYHCDRSKVAGVVWSKVADASRELHLLRRGGRWRATARRRQGPASPPPRGTAAAAYTRIPGIGAENQPTPVMPRRAGGRQATRGRVAYPLEARTALG